MSNRQFFAQIGVFVLVGVNVAAYYVFWPKGDRAAAVDAKGPDNLVQSLKVDKKTPSTRPPEAPEPSPGPSAGKEAEKDAVSRLLEKINAEGPVAAAPFNVENLPPIPAPLKPDSPPALPSLLADLRPAAPGEFQKVGQATLTPTTALAAQIQESPWLLKMEIVGNQTQLIAQGPSATLMRFKILCDRVETKAPDGVLHAVGKVTFYGAGFRGRCQRLTLSLDKMRVVFEDQVEIATADLHVDRDRRDSIVDERVPPGSMLRSDKIVWEAPHAAVTHTNEVRPATFNPPTPLSRTILDAPR